MSQGAQLGSARDAHTSYSADDATPRLSSKLYNAPITLQAESQPLLSNNVRSAPSAHRHTLATAFIVAAWFSSNIGLLLMNKFLLSNYGFKQPVFLTVCHMFACVVLSSAFSTTTYVPKKRVQSSQQLLKIAVLATVFALSVVLGNISLKYIPVSFSQVFLQYNTVLCLHPLGSSRLH